MQRESAERIRNNGSGGEGRQRPNVVVIVPHDIGDYLGCYGHTVSTPNLDRMAQEGMRFANHFSTSPMCSPARGSIITGKYPHTNGLMGLCNLGWDLPKHNITDGQLFADAGYRTYLGYQHEKKNSADLGFHHTVSVNSIEHLLQTFHAELVSGKDCQPFYIRMGTCTGHRGHDPENGYYGYHTNQDRGLAESDVAVRPNWKDTPGLRYDLKGFTGDLKCLDNEVGDILKALEKHNFDENTIVVFTADHGIDFPGGKGTLYDLGLRTALIMRYPKRIMGGKVFKGLTSHIDIMPTLIELCGFDRMQSIQGTSLVPAIDGTSNSLHEEIFAEESTFPKNLKRCIRTGQYKLIRNFCTGIQSNATICAGSRTVADTGQYYFVNRPEYELYDLAADPYELHNLAGTEACRRVEADLRERLNRWMRATHDPVLDGSIRRPADESDLFPKNLLNEHSKLLWE